jgi:hypothetical protein
MDAQETQETKTTARRSRSPLLFQKLRDIRGHAKGCKCSKCTAERMRGYSYPHRYGMRTTVTTRRVDRVDPDRELY